MIAANSSAVKHSRKVSHAVSHSPTPEEEIWKFLTRSEKMSRTKFPESCPGKFVIKGKSDGFGYREDVDMEEVRSLPLTYPHIMQIIKDLNCITNKVYCTKRKNDDYDFLQDHLGLLKLIFLVTIVGFIVLTVSDYKRDNESIFYAGLIILAIAGFMVIAAAFLLIFRERKHINLLKELTKQLTACIDEKNRELENYGGCSMTLESELRWIELDYFA